MKESGPIKNILELFSFVFNTFMVPVILYKIINKFEDNTIKPYEELYKGLTQSKCAIDEETGRWPFSMNENYENLIGDDEIDCHKWSYRITFQFYFIFGFLAVKHYIFDGVGKEVRA